MDLIDFDYQVYFFFFLPKERCEGAKAARLRLGRRGAKAARLIRRGARLRGEGRRSKQISSHSQSRKPHKIPSAIDHERF